MVLSNTEKNRLVNGKIPVGSECPYKERCGEALQGLCGHTGKTHTVDYSCGYARLFAILEKE